MDKTKGKGNSKGSSETTGLTGTLENAENWIKETNGTTVQNPNYNKEIHKQAQGRNAKR